MCCSKQIFYAHCAHWHRSLSTCSNQKRQMQCSMIFLPDVEYEDLCPDCSAYSIDVTCLQALHLTDRFRPSHLHCDDHPAFKDVQYRASSYYELDSPTGQFPSSHGLGDIRVIGVPGGLRELSASAVSSPPQSPFGTRRQSWSSSTSTATFFDDEIDANHLLGASAHAFFVDLHEKYMRQQGSRKAGNHSSGISHGNAQHMNRRMAEQERRQALYGWMRQCKSGTERCRYGSHCVLDQAGDDRERKLCQYHKHAKGQNQLDATCRK